LDLSELDKMSATELAVLIKKAREVRARKATPSVKINGYVASVGKHVNSALEAVKKLMASDGVPERKWEDVENQLRRLQLDVYREEASKVKLTARGSRAGAKSRK
jgi:hypothetical protein